MKLLGDFFEVLETFQKESGFSTTIKLNPDHLVYTGHFPGHPVTPGVIQLQIVHELLEKYFNEKLKLLSMPQCKFLKIMNPNEIAQILIQIEFERVEKLLHVSARGEEGTDTYFRLKTNYQFL